jgi:subtilisin family serine protease
MAPVSTLLSSLALLGSLFAPLADAGPLRSSRVLGVPTVNPDAKDLIPNAYIVVYNGTFDDDGINQYETKLRAKISKRNIGKRGLDGRFLSRGINSIRIGNLRAMALEADDKMMLDIFDAEEVAYIEQDALVQTREVKLEVRALASQPNAPNGLARLSHADANETGYVFDTSGGEGITAFVVDTGIMIGHSEFQGRATWGANFVNDVVSHTIS